ncbi:MAG: NYN domain-containing protein, partial [Candidatus Dormibacteraeota bacterium]|nr:NYN domain-containing protein [Candidatus Dormibacteraeota bacterium]
MPDTGKVALFVDFDNIRIGIRQHFSSPSRNAEIHPGKLMAKASTYGRVITAKAYADFTGHPKEFQDKLLFAAGIEPIHAPSKISGGRRQSSADMHMVIDMFLEAIDHEDTDTFVLMTGDADFVRMVATLRRRFGRKVIISGVQSTSTSLDLMNAADGRDPITRQDVDLTGELGPMTRPLVTRADLEARAEAAAAEVVPQKGIGGIFGGLFRRKAPQGAAPQVGRTTAGPTPPAAPPTPLAPRRMRA